MTSYTRSGPLVEGEWVRLTDPKGSQIAGQVCPKGQWALNVLGTGDVGNYNLTIDLEKFTGTIDIKEARK